MARRYLLVYLFLLLSPRVLDDLICSGGDEFCGPDGATVPDISYYPSIHTFQCDSIAGPPARGTGRYYTVRPGHTVSRLQSGDDLHVVIMSSWCSLSAAQSSL